MQAQGENSSTDVVNNSLQRKDPQRHNGIVSKKPVDPRDITHPERYEYPLEEKYRNLENHVLFNVVGGLLCMEYNCRYQVSINEVSALYINKNAKFSKIYRKGCNKPFLLPHNFIDDAMRNYYIVKYHSFLDGGRESNKNLIWEGYFFGGKPWKKMVVGDFKEEHLMQQRLEKKYLSSSTNISHDTDGKSSEENVDSEAEVESDSTTYFNSLFSDETIAAFVEEVENSRKRGSHGRDACIREWEVRMITLNIVDQISKYLEQMCDGHVPNICNCDKRHSRICDTVRQKLGSLFELVREGNRVDSESNKDMSEVVFATVFRLSQIKDRLIIVLSRETYLNEHVNEILGNMKVIMQFFVTYGCHDTKLFVGKNSVYDSLKKRGYRICCVCGVRRMLLKNASNLKDALEFKHLLVVEKDKLENWLSLKYDDEDDLGTVSQECYHIAFAEGDQVYYHILDYDETSLNDDDDGTIHTLIKNGKLSNYQLAKFASIISEGHISLFWRIRRQR